MFIPRSPGAIYDASKVDPAPELYFATVRAIGTNIEPVVEQLKSRLKEARYFPQEIKVSECLDLLATKFGHTEVPKDEDLFDRYVRLGEAAMELRLASQRQDAVVLAAIEQLSTQIRDSTKAKLGSSRGAAYIFRNVMHPSEVQRLRKLYDRPFFLISIYSPQTNRIHGLARKLDELEALPDVELGKVDDDRAVSGSSAALAQMLVEMEESYYSGDEVYDPSIAVDLPYLTNIPSTFQHADLFLDSADAEGNTTQVKRFVDLIFGEPFFTPSGDEVAMAAAFAAAQQSGNLARQVGAAICSERGDILAVGTNDVPRPGGGVYRYGDDNDARDAIVGYDSSDVVRRDMLIDFVRRLIGDPVWLSELDPLIQSIAPQYGNCGSALADALASFADVDEGDERSIFDEGGPIRSTAETIVRRLIQSELIGRSQVLDVLEYGRTLHAEMDAITTAARRGVPLQDATLYCTTLPCHECARLIIGSGIRRVIFIEPFEKSRSAELYPTEINFTTLAESRARDGRALGSAGNRRNPLPVDFCPYVGVSPRRFNALFSFVERKNDDKLNRGDRELSGETVHWTISEGVVRESIVSHNALNSSRRLRDLLGHEEVHIKNLHKCLGVIYPDDETMTAVLEP